MFIVLLVQSHIWGKNIANKILWIPFLYTLGCIYKSEGGIRLNLHCNMFISDTVYLFFQNAFLFHNGHCTILYLYHRHCRHADFLFFFCFFFLHMMSWKDILLCYNTSFLLKALFSFFLKI